MLNCWKLPNKNHAPPSSALVAMIRGNRQIFPVPTVVPIIDSTAPMEDVKLAYRTIGKANENTVLYIVVPYLQ